MPVSAVESRRPALFTSRFWFRMIQVLSGLTWGLFLSALFMLGTARPEVETYMDQRWNKDVRTWWDMEMVRLSAKFLVAAALLCALAIVLNLLVKRVRPNRYSRVFIPVGLASAIVFAIVEMHF